MVDQPLDFPCRQLPGGNEGVDAELSKEFFVALLQVVAALYPGYRPAGAEFFGQHGSNQIGVFGSGDGQKEVGPVDFQLLHQADRGSIPANGQDVEMSGRIVQHLLVGVDDDDVLIFVGQQLRQVETHVTGSGYDDFHLR